MLPLVSNSTTSVLGLTALIRACAASRSGTRSTILDFGLWIVDWAPAGSPPVRADRVHASEISAAGALAALPGRLPAHTPIQNPKSKIQNRLIRTTPSRRGTPRP